MTKGENGGSPRINGQEPWYQYIYRHHGIDMLLFGYIIQTAVMLSSKKEYLTEGEHKMGDKSKVLKPSMKKAKKAPESAPAKTPEPVKKADPKPQPKK